MSETEIVGISSLNGGLDAQEVSMSLTEAGLLPDRVQQIVQLYAQHHNWTEVKDRWHANRVHERGSRDSAQGIFRILKRRLQAGGSSLPPLDDLQALVQACPTDQATAQLFYFYLIQEDALFRFVLHEVLRRQGLDRDEWTLSTERIASLLDSFEYEDGSGLTYAESTLHRWAQGFRSVLRDIGVIEGPYDETGTVPAVDAPPLHLSARFSYSEEGQNWPRRPLGWMYLFQPRTRWDVLLDRVRSSPRWTASQLRDQEVLTPTE